MISFIITFSVLALIVGGAIGALLGLIYFLSPLYKTPLERRQERIDVFEKSRLDSLKGAEEKVRKDTEGMTPEERERYSRKITEQAMKYLRGEL